MSAFSGSPSRGVGRPRAQGFWSEADVAEAISLATELDAKRAEIWAAAEEEARRREEEASWPLWEMLAQLVKDGYPKTRAVSEVLGYSKGYVPKLDAILARVMGSDGVRELKREKAKRAPMGVAWRISAVDVGMLRSIDPDMVRIILDAGADAGGSGKGWSDAPESVACWTDRDGQSLVWVQLQTGSYNEDLLLAWQEDGMWSMVRGMGPVGKRPVQGKVPDAVWDRFVEALRFSDEGIVRLKAPQMF